MNSITEDLLAQLQGNSLSQMSRQIGLPEEQTRDAIAAALPLLVGALGRNASQPQGAESLLGALGRDHSGLDIGGVLGAVLGGGGQGPQILGHIFGQREQRAAQGLGAATGLGGDRANALLRLLAPVVMAYIAKRMYDRRHATDGASAGGASPTFPGSGPTTEVLKDVLGKEQQTINQQGGIGGKLITAVLDRDKDGDVDFSDLIGMGGSVLGRRPS